MVQLESRVLVGDTCLLESESDSFSSAGDGRPAE
jgi:hypothetical protein